MDPKVTHATRSPAQCHRIVALPPATVYDPVINFHLKREHPLGLFFVNRCYDDSLHVFLIMFYRGQYPQLPAYVYVLLIQQIHT